MSITRKTPPNRFKQEWPPANSKSACGQSWQTVTRAELIAGCGYDWLLIDAEHGPNDLRAVLAQLQGIAAAGSLLGDRQARTFPARRTTTHGDTSLIKQYLEIGVQNLLIPMVDTAAQAAELVRRCATRRTGCGAWAAAWAGPPAGDD